MPMSICIFKLLLVRVFILRNRKKIIHFRNIRSYADWKAPIVCKSRDENWKKNKMGRMHARPRSASFFPKKEKEWWRWNILWRLKTSRIFFFCGYEKNWKCMQWTCLRVERNVCCGVRDLCQNWTNQQCIVGTIGSFGSSLMMMMLERRKSMHQWQFIPLDSRTLRMCDQEASTNHIIHKTRDCIQIFLHHLYSKCTSTSTHVNSPTTVRHRTSVSLWGCTYPYIIWLKYGDIHFLKKQGKLGTSLRNLFT